MTHAAEDTDSPRSSRIKLHGPADFEGMRKAGRLTAEALDLLVPHVKPGVTTDELDSLIVDFARAHNAVPAPYNYRGYPKSICTSINHVVCHGIPNDKPLRDGDIVNIDVTLIVDGWHGDSSRMYMVGEVNRKAERLVEVTYECLMRGIAMVKPGMFFTIEPMINLGRPHVKILGDGWTAVTRDRSLSAQFEHTVAVTETGVEIFTLSPKGFHHPPYTV